MKNHQKNDKVKNLRIRQSEVGEYWPTEYEYKYEYKYEYWPTEYEYEYEYSRIET